MLSLFILALRSSRQTDLCEFEESLVYKARFCCMWGEVNYVEWSALKSFYSYFLKSFWNMPCQRSTLAPPKGFLFVQKVVFPTTMLETSVCSSTSSWWLSLRCCVILLPFKCLSHPCAPSCIAVVVGQPPPHQHLFCHFLHLLMMCPFLLFSYFEI